MKWKSPYWIFLGLFLFAAIHPLERATNPRPLRSAPKKCRKSGPKSKWRKSATRRPFSVSGFIEGRSEERRFHEHDRDRLPGPVQLRPGQKVLSRAAKADKKYSSAVNNLGMVYYHQKNFRAAIREYKRAVAIDPDQAGTHSNLGFAYYNTNKYPEAAAEFQRAIEIDPSIFERNDRVGAMVQDRSVSNHGLFFFTMAKVYAQKRDAAHCAEYLRKSLDEGYKDIGKAATDPAFKDVINDPVVQAVLVRVVPAEQKGTATHPARKLSDTRDMRRHALRGLCYNVTAMPPRIFRFGLFVLGAALCGAVTVGRARSAQSTGDARAASAEAHHETILIFPFENESRMANLDWLGEGLSELTAERLEDRDVNVLSRRGPAGDAGTNGPAGFRAIFARHDHENRGGSRRRRGGLWPLPIRRQDGDAGSAACCT